MKAVVHIHRPENRLSKAIEGPGGVTIGEALARAEEGLAAVREECLSSLDIKIAEIESLISTGGPLLGPNIRKIYALASEVLGEAGAFQLVELSEAGRSLCELTGVSSHDAVLDVRAVRVHVEAMKSLRRPEIAGDSATRTAVLDGLRKVTSMTSSRPKES